MTISESWRRVLRRTLRVLAVLASVIILAWLGLAWYINTHKQEILTQVSKRLGDRMRGDLHIRSIEPSLFRSFPNVELDLQDVSLRDSMWTIHKHSLLEASHMFVRINPIALLSRRTEIGKITASGGSIFIYTDSTGYSNTYLLSKRDTTKKNRTAEIDRFGMNDMHLWFVNDAKKKLFHLYFKNLDGTAIKNTGILQVKVKANAHIHEFNFNTIRGSYLHEQDLDLNLAINYHLSDKRMEIPDQKIHIGKKPVYISGNFFFDRTPPAFTLRLHTESIQYKTAVSWMSPNIRKVLDSFDFGKPIALDARVSGEMKYKSIPLVNVTYQVENNRFITPMGDIDHISYNGFYRNEALPGAGHGDDNSRVGMYGLKGTWRNIPFQGDTVWVTNLLKPVVKAHITSSFAVPAVNEIVGGSVMAFNEGKAIADLRYEGGILPDDPTPYAINGYVRVQDAGLTYIPRNLQFSHVGATLIFSGDNLYFRNITLHSRNSSVVMDGDAMHFLRLYFSDPGKVTLDWKVRSPLVNLNDFISFVGKRKTTAAASRPTSAPSISRIANQLDRVLEASSISLDARLDKMVYKKFTANAVIARATIAQSGIVLQQVQIRNGGGSVTISGVMNQSEQNNPFAMKAVVRNEDVARLFRSFDNFGQQAIAADNLQGRVDADADLRGKVTESGTILKNSLQGTVTFNLSDGQINHFSPFEKVGRFVFKKRNLSAVSVKSLSGQFDLNGDKITIRPMAIQTSVVNINVQGVYGLNGGTDIYMEIPLRNPEKEEASTQLGKLLRRGKGFVVNLRAQDPDGTGVRIGWDPRKNGRKATDELLSK